mgnify:CR=1 FL=1
MLNYYDILELQPGANIKDIEHKYKYLSIINHPNKGLSKELFNNISESYQVLSNPILRKYYDNYDMNIGNTGFNTHRGYHFHLKFTFVDSIELFDNMTTINNPFTTRFDKLLNKF